MEQLFYRLPEEIKNEPYLLATYYIVLDKCTDAMEKAKAMAVGQTIGTWVPVPGVTDEMRRNHMGSVVSVYEIPPSELSPMQEESIPYLFQIAYPTANMDACIPMLITTLLGNDASTSAQAKLIDIQFPEKFAEGLGGPSYGIEGLRKLAGVSDRPLFLNMIKPCTGMPAEVGAKIFYETACGGVDFIKDDELLANPSFCRVSDRVKAYRAAADAAFEKTGHHTIYICNITDSASKILDTAKEALDAGAEALMVNFAAAGPDTLQMIRDYAHVPVMGHYAGAGMYCEGRINGMSSHLLVGKLSRMCGADCVMINTPYGGYPLTHLEYRKTVQMLTLPLYGIKASMPILGGGVHPGIVPLLMKENGTDVILAAGGAVQGHRDGAAAGAMAMRQAIDAVMEGTDIYDYAEEHTELMHALEQFDRRER